MTPNVIERNPGAYELSMRLRYGRQFSERLRAVASEVPPAAAVVELCCGPGTLYTHYLQGHVSSYVGLDVNERFVASLRRRGVDARPMDLANPREPIPSGDVVILQSGLHEFDPDPAHIIDRMLAAARRLVIVSEPIRGDADTPSPLRRIFASGKDHRLTEEALDQLFEPYRELLVKVRLLARGREKLHVLRAG